MGVNKFTGVAAHPRLTSSRTRDLLVTSPLQRHRIQTDRARRNVLGKILSSAEQQCRNKLYNKFRTNRSNEVKGLQLTSM